MSIYQGSSTNPDRRLSLKGAVMVDVSMGKERVRAWPRPRGANQAPSVVHNQMLFRNYSWAIKYLDPEMMTQIYDARQGMPLLPRDVAMMMLSGTLLWFSTPSGKAIYSMAALQAVSQSLDAISQLEGHVLVRGAQYWTAVPYTPSGQPWWWMPPDMTGWTLLTTDANPPVVDYDPMTGGWIDLGPLAGGTVYRYAFMPIPVPASPWTCEFRSDNMQPAINSSGLLFGCNDSSSGQTLMWLTDSGDTTYAFKFNALNGGNTNFGAVSKVPASPPLFWRLSYDGTIIYWHFSVDGVHWTYFQSVIRASYMNNHPDRIGVGGYLSRTTGFQSVMNVTRFAFAQ